MFYLTKTPVWMRAIHRDAWWKMPVEDKKIFLSFDDGPHPSITPFVMDELDRVNAKASFFCIGNNVRKFPEVYQALMERGHRTGNHTHDHLNGWKSTNEVYVDNVKLAGNWIDSNLFRPPHGRLKNSQKKMLKLHKSDFQLVMWDVLSGDFDLRLDHRDCMKNVMKGVEPGSIIVFHDSEKAYPRLGKMLRETLERLADKGFQMVALP